MGRSSSVASQMKMQNIIAGNRYQVDKNKGLCSLNDSTALCSLCGVSYLYAIHATKCPRRSLDLR